jgi:uncharacterized membrane protein YebE (DUF533 family)
VTLPKELLPDKEWQDQLIIAFPESDFGRAFLSRVKAWHDEASEDYFLSLKICDEDIKQDLRFKAGFLYALGKVLKEPERLRQNQITRRASK